MGLKINSRVRVKKVLKSTPNYILITGYTFGKSNDGKFKVDFNGILFLTNNNVKVEEKDVIKVNSLEVKNYNSGYTFFLHDWQVEGLNKYAVEDYNSEIDE